MNGNTTIGFGSGADDFMVMNRATVDKLWDLGSDAYTLYGFYFKTAKWQKTNQIKAVDTYTMSCLKWGKDRLRGAKNGLKTSGLITVLQAKKRGVIDGWYIRVEYLVPEKKVPVSGHEIIEVADTENKLSVDDLIDGLKSFSPEEIHARIPQDLIKSSGVFFPEDSKTTHWSEVANALILLTKCFNTLSKKNKQKEDDSWKGIHDEAILHLNKVASKSFRGSKESKANVKARVMDGYKLEDFVFVIENKFEESIADEFWKKYINPKTLFGTKMDRYLNEPDIRKGKQSEASNLLEKVKDADSKVLELNGLKANEFKAKLVKFSKEEAAYLILTEQLHAMWYDFFFGGPSNPNIEIFKAMATALGIEYNRDANTSNDNTTDCEVIESNSCGI